MKNTEREPELKVEGFRPIRISDVFEVAVKGRKVKLEGTPRLRDRMDRSRRILDEGLAKGERIYGVTTGFGGSCGDDVSPEDVDKLGKNLLQYHKCGTGTPLEDEHVRAAMLCRLVCLCAGYSGVSLELPDQIVKFLNERITPIVPSEGSVGASGDLTPMSYVAACLAGEREVRFRGKRMETREALEATGIAPYRFKAKEPLAMVNGTAVMTGLAALAAWRGKLVLDAAIRASALAVHALCGNAEHFHKAVFDAKPYAGQARVAERMRELLRAVSPPPVSDAPENLQDPYSLRCVPHVLGVLADALDWIEPWIETEINGVSDNPLFDPETGEILMGGNFYGGHVAFAMDSIKIALAAVADLADRQIALMIDPRFNRGLPANLSDRGADLHGMKGICHGLKGVQITASALTAEAQKNTMPASVFSRPTEMHNQDIVSMGTIAARDAVRNCELTERVAAIHLMAAARACRLRGHLDGRPELAAFLKKLNCIEMRNDEGFDVVIERTASAVRSGDFLEKVHDEK